MIAVIDYDASAAAALAESLRTCGADARPTSAPDDVVQARKIVLPHASSARQAARNLRDAGLIGPLLRAVDRGAGMLAVSCGLHLLFDAIYGEDVFTGLGLIPGKVIPFDAGTRPAARHFGNAHQGWNRVHFSGECPLLAGVASGSFFYFEHVGHAEPDEPHVVIGETNHGVDFCSILWQDNVFGTQFLPERSDATGRILLRNFAAI